MRVPDRDLRSELVAVFCSGSRPEVDAASVGRNVQHDDALHVSKVHL